MKIDVTQDDIDAGKPGCNYNCPVAITLQRVFPGAYVRVERDEIVIGFKTYLSPKAVSEFIYDFDGWKEDSDEERDDPEPFSFELPVEA